MRKKEGVILQRKLIIFIILIGAIVLLLNVPSWLSFGKQQKAQVSKNIDTIKIDVSGISTTIIPEKRDNVEAKLDGQGSVHVDQNGDSIEIDYERKWFNGFNFFNHPKLTIYIPEDYNRDMEMEVGSGNIDFNGQKLQLNELSLDVSSGNIQMSHVSAENGLLDISSGNINIKNYRGQLEADVSSGNLDIRMDQLTDSVKVDLSSGHVLLDLPDNANFTLNGEINSGAISNQFTLKDQQQNKHELKGTHGTGEHQLDLSVSSGRTEIR